MIDQYSVPMYTTAYIYLVYIYIKMYICIYQWGISKFSYRHMYIYTYIYIYVYVYVFYIRIYIYLCRIPRSSAVSLSRSSAVVASSAREYIHIKMHARICKCTYGCICVHKTCVTYVYLCVCVLFCVSFPRHSTFAANSVRARIHIKIHA